MTFISQFKYAVAENDAGRKVSLARGQISAALEKLLLDADAYVDPIPGSIIPSASTLPATLAPGQNLALQFGQSYYTAGTVLKGGNTIAAFGDSTKGRPVILVTGETGAGLASYDRHTDGLLFQNFILVPAVPEQRRRPDGIVLRASVGPVSFKDVNVTGFEQNVTLEAKVANYPIVLDGLVSQGAWALDADELHSGQGLYIDTVGPGGAIQILNSKFYHNGIQLGNEAMWDSKERNQYAHGVYHNVGSNRLVIKNSEFNRNQHSGVQTRSGADIDGSIFVDNAISLLAVIGQTSLSSSVIYDAHRYWTGTAWDGADAILAYDLVTVSRVAIIAGPSYRRVEPPIGKAFEQGALNASGGWVNGTMKSRPEGGRIVNSGGGITVDASWGLLLGGQFKSTLPASIPRVDYSNRSAQFFTDLANDALPVASRLASVFTPAPASIA